MSLQPNGINKMNTIRENSSKEQLTIFEQFDAMSEYNIIEGMKLLDFHIRDHGYKENRNSKDRLLVFILMKGFVLSYVHGK